MSHDELLPDATPPHDTAEAERDPVQEPSSSDAPPAAPVRRRRAKAAEPAAASAPETPPAEKSARPTRRRKTAEAAEEPPAALPVQTEAEPAAPVAKPVARTRRSRTAAAPAIETATAPEAALQAADQPAQEAISAVPPVEAPRRRTRRAKAEPGLVETATPQAVVMPDIEPFPETPPVETAAEPEANAAAPAETETAPDKPSRRRTTRRAKNAPEPVAAAPEIVPAAEAPAAAETIAPTETTPAAEPERRGRRRRGRRQEINEAAVIEGIAAPPPIPEAAVPAPTAETAAPERTRRSRRNPRPRRDQGEPVPAEAGIVTVPILPLPVIEREPVIDRTVGAHLILRNGQPEIRINDVFQPPVLFFGSVEEEATRHKVVAEARRAADAGVHLHSTLVELPCPLSESGDALDRFDNRVRTMLDADPEGFVMPRVVFVPARGWKREYPTDIATYTDGPISDPSLTSERFWQEAERALLTLIAHVREQLWGPRIFGYHLERGEWFQSADLGYDRSVANRDAFRDWLREKYRHDLVGIRAAWYDGDVQFHTAEIPPLITKPNPQRAFYETRRERPYIDFNEFTSESTARRLTGLAKAAKKAAEHKALVSVCYGYTFEFGHGFSGHLALDILLASPHIDIISGPPSYRDRKPGGASSLPVPTDSIALHGKLFLSEDDTKTYLAPAAQEPDDYNPRLADKFATEQAQARAMGRALAHRTAVGWMDLWGEGWLDEESLWERIETFTSRCETSAQGQTGPRSSEVVALIDEKSLLHIQRGEPFFRKITNGLRDTLQRAGISLRIYLQSDLLEDNFPLDAKLYLFLTPYRLNTAHRAAIQEKLQRDGKTLAFLYAPGACEARPTVGGAMEEVAGGSVGIILRQQEWNSEIGSRVVDPHHVLTSHLPGREIGTKERLNPSFFVDDPQAAALAEYQGSGLTSVAVRDFGTWKSVFVGEPALPLELLRGICRYAGVHLWTGGGDDVFVAGNGWIMLHASRDGNRTLKLPGAAPLYDVTERRLISDDGREYRFFVRGGSTRLFFAGTTQQMNALGLPNATLPGSRPRISLDIPPPVSTTRPEPETPTLRSDLETLEAVLKMDVSALEFSDEAAEVLELLTDKSESDENENEPKNTDAPLLLDDDSDDPDTGRPRRRRGGRGRGRRRVGSITEGKEDVLPAADTGIPAPPPEPFLSPFEGWPHEGNS